MIKRRGVLWIGGVALACAALYWLLTPRPIFVETAKVSTEPLRVFVEQDGRTRIRDRYVITSPLAGRVPRSSLRVGDAVKVSQVLTTVAPNVSPLIDPRVRRELEERVGVAQAAVEEAAALFERAHVQLARARNDLDRTTQLNSRGVASMSQFDRDTYALKAAERDKEAADRRRHAAEHALEEAQSALKRNGAFEGGERFPIKSPIEGEVLKIIQQSEGAIALGEPLLEIGNTSDLEVIVDLLTSDAAQVRQGARVMMHRSGLGVTLEGRVRRVEPSAFTKVSALGVEEQRVWVVVDIVSPRNLLTDLGDGYRVAAEILVDEIENAIVIPTGSLFRRGEDWCVFVVEGDRSKLRKIEVRRRSGRTAAVSNGLRTGEVVVVYPPSALSDGVYVSVVSSDR